MPSPSPTPTSDALKKAVIGALQQIYDPELHIDIHSLGLIYGIDVQPDSGHVKVTMTLTTPACPFAETLPEEVKFRIEQLPEVHVAEVELTFDPPYTLDNLSDAAKLQLGML